MIYLPIFFRVASLALLEQYNCPGASEVTLKYMDRTDLYQTKTKNKPWCRILGTYCMVCIHYITFPTKYIMTPSYFAVSRESFLEIFLWCFQVSEWLSFEAFLDIKVNKSDVIITLFPKLIVEINFDQRKQNISEIKKNWGQEIVSEWSLFLKSIWPIKTITCWITNSYQQILTNGCQKNILFSDISNLQLYPFTI